MKKLFKKLGVLVGILILISVLYFALIYATIPSSNTVKAISNGPFYFLVKEQDRLLQYRSFNDVQAIVHKEIPQHPFMAANPGNNMHNDASMSDTSESSGPQGIKPEIKSRTQGFGGYGTVTFNRSGQLVAVNSNGRKFQLELMDANTLEELASYDLPPRPWFFLLQGVLPWEYIGAGTYFYLDNQDRAVVPTTMNTVKVIQTPDMLNSSAFELVREYDLGAHVVTMHWPKQDSVAWVLPDWSGEYYWFATTQGVVGTIDANSGAIHTLRLIGELIENSFAVGPDGVFIVSDHAMYRFSSNEERAIITHWRREYDRGSRKKPGLITRGSGASVTLMGAEDGYIAITDNADSRVHLLFIKRSDGTIVCQEPLFQADKSATDITAIGFEAAEMNETGTSVFSAIVENNWGHNTFPRARPAPGITRVDLFAYPDGSYSCKTIWTSPEKNIGVFKISLGNGLIYLYFRDDSFIQKWYLTTLDFHTGEIMYKALVGTGLGYNNWAGALFLHPEGGIAYSTTIFGIVMIRDSTR